MNQPHNQQPWMSQGTQASDPHPTHPNGHALPVPATPRAAQHGYPLMSTGMSRGPLGRHRNIAVIILLSIVTLGIYSLVWTYQTYAEMKRHRNAGISGVAGLLLSFIPFVQMFLLPSEVAGLYRAANRPSPVSAATGLWNLLPFLGAFVWLFKVQGALNEYWSTSADPTAQFHQANRSNA